MSDQNSLSGGGPQRSGEGQHDYTIDILLHAAARRQRHQHSHEPQQTSFPPRSHPQMPQLSPLVLDFASLVQQHIGAASSRSNTWPGYLPPSTASAPAASAVSSVATSNISMLQNEQVAIPYEELMKLFRNDNSNDDGHRGKTSYGKMGSPSQEPTNEQLAGGLGSNNCTVGSASPFPQRHVASRLPMAHASGTRTFPCRARGMPETHNFNTAVLTVTEDTGHGDSLICSHPACRDGGIKFAYCLHCRRSVSKRLFRGKHKYCTAEDNEANNKAKKSPPGPKSTGQDHARVSSSGGTTEATPSAETSRESNMGHDDNKSDDGLADDSDDHDDDDAKPPASPVGKKRKARDEFEEVVVGDLLVQAFIREACDDNTTMEPWTRLLLMRPSTNDESKMAAWLQAVLQVSQTEKERVTGRLRDKID